MNPQANNDREVDCSATVDPTARHNSAGGGGGGGARYKLMSPAKLPISRSTTNITIPPGLSPTSFLESPVFISNIKVKPLLSLSPLESSQRFSSLCGFDWKKVRFFWLHFGKLGLALELNSVNFPIIQKRDKLCLVFLLLQFGCRPLFHAPNS